MVGAAVDAEDAVEEEVAAAGLREENDCDWERGNGRGSWAGTSFAPEVNAEKENVDDEDDDVGGEI